VNWLTPGHSLNARVFIDTRHQSHRLGSALAGKSSRIFLKNPTAIAGPGAVGNRLGDWLNWSSNDRQLDIIAGSLLNLVPARRGWFPLATRLQIPATAWQYSSPGGRTNSPNIFLLEASAVRGTPLIAAHGRPDAWAVFRTVKIIRAADIAGYLYSPAAQSERVGSYVHYSENAP